MSKYIMRVAVAKVKFSTKVKVLFCGTGHMASAFINTRENLKDEKDIEVITSDDVEKEMKDATVVIPLMQKISASLIEASPNLKAIIQFGVGLETVDIEAATRANVQVCRIPSREVGNAQACAEFSVYLLMSVLRNQKAMSLSLTSQRIGFPTGQTIMGKTALIIGYGGIGRELALRLKPFQLDKVFVLKRSPLSEKERTNDPLLIDGTISEIGYLEEEEQRNLGKKERGESFFSRVLPSVDVVFLCCTQNSQNHGMIDSAFISQLKRGSVVINVSRGKLVNYNDVLIALNSGHLFGFGTDVFHTEPFPNPKDDLLLSHPNVVATPHVAGVTVVSYVNMAAHLSNNIRRIRAGLPASGAVN